MAIACGIVALLLGALSFTATFVRAYQNEYQKSHDNEMVAVGWFILAALCFK